MNPVIGLDVSKGESMAQVFCENKVLDWSCWFIAVFVLKNRQLLKNKF